MHRTIRGWRPLGAVLFLLGLSVAPSGTAAPGLATPQSVQQDQKLNNGFAVASAHPLATQVGMAVLRSGGNAFDAAIAVTAMLAVVEPSGSGLGGGGFYLLHDADSKRDVMVDARERAPLAAHRDLYLGTDGRVVPGLSVNGPLAAGIPGIPAALDHLARLYASRPLAELLSPAIRVARDGFGADEHLLRYLGFRKPVMQGTPAGAVFLRGGELPAAGTLIRQEDLARALERIARDGGAGFYAGPLARQLVNGVRAAGGIWTLRDLEEYAVVERAPIITRYRGHTVISAAPPSSGGVALATLLNMLADRDPGESGAVERMHLLTELMRRAYRDRAIHLGDPDHVRVPIERLTSQEHARALAADFDPDTATPSALLEDAPAHVGGGQNTTHFSIMDARGNRVAATLSINYPFGSGFMVPGTGILLNNEMDDFSAAPGVPNGYGLVGSRANAIAPGKRMLSSMSPTFIEHADGHGAILGTPGGSRIITMVLLGILEYLESGDADAMVASPRFHHQYLPDVLQYEEGTLDETRRATLEAMGHNLKAVPRGFYGNMQVVTWETGRETNGGRRLAAASDPRGGGQSAVQNPQR
ncbi:MAG: gamma-glutamyltransferase [Gammaproteobacteria bacterium]